MFVKPLCQLFNLIQSTFGIFYLCSYFEQHFTLVLIQPDFSSDPPCYSDVKNGIEAGEEAARLALPKILAVLKAA